MEFFSDGAGRALLHATDADFESMAAGAMEQAVAISQQIEAEDDVAPPVEPAKEEPQVSSEPTPPAATSEVAPEPTPPNTIQLLEPPAPQPELDRSKPEDVSHYPRA